MPLLDLILPAYKPCIGWHKYALRRLHELHMARPEWEVRLIVVSDGSPCGHEPEVLAAFAEGMQGRFTHIHYLDNRGKGYALRQAVAASSADYILYTDWDFPFTTESYLSALDSLKDGAAVVLPVRKISEYRRHLNLRRRFFSLGSHLINCLLLGLPSKDTQGGIKAFDQRGRAVFLQTSIDRFLFDTEFIVLATRAQIDLRQTSCHVRPEIVMSSMSWSTLCQELRYIPRLFLKRWFY